MSIEKYKYYSDSHCTIYHGDCRDVLPELSEVDLVLTDPPYGVTQNEWDETAAVYECFDKLDKWVCTSQNPFSAALIWRYKHLFKYSNVWEKSQAVGFLNCKVMPLRKHEDILVFGNVKYNPQIKKKPIENIRPESDRTKQTDNYNNHPLKSVRSIPIDMEYPTSILKIENEQNTIHPTQKPIKLFKHLILTYSNENEIILDPFMGSGTALRAAKDLNRKCIGIEIEEKYCEIAVKRLQQEVLQF